MTKFSELPLVPVIAKAISDRGYETATPVQVAVLDASLKDRDVLVSSQTGSGKTLAFGAMIAQVLLGKPAIPEADETEVVPDTKAPRRPARGRAPSTLVIAPTRELANQVQTELFWLFAHTGLKVASFTGGSDIRRDLHNLQTGLDVAVGTPGRLVDLLNREALRLDEVKIVVLDEADEMLDMGFRDDLEILLGKAGARLHTYMFSATLPRPILSLAAKYQKNAARIDARTLGESDTHEDICHLAHLVAMGDRVPAVINVLRQNGEGRAIVFGTTRDGVADLHRELVRQGFRAVVLSGDRAQSERNRALSALREGEAQILVATNVAARGLDLPEVDLVVHADLPLNVEALTHRSGRTGRAGRKGTSVLIATLAERRKAERLMQAARVTAHWTLPPSADDLAKQSATRLQDTLRCFAESKTKPSAAAMALGEQLTAEIPAEQLLLHLLDRELARMPRGESLRPVDLISTRNSQRARNPSGPPPSRSDFSRDSVLFQVNLGQESKAEPGWLLPLICRRGGITRREVGAIRVLASHSEFEILGEAASDFELAASQPDPRAQNVHIQRKHRPGRSSQASPSSRRESAIRPRPPARPTPTPPHVERAPSRITQPSRPAVENHAVVAEIPALRPSVRPSASPITFGKFNRDSNVPPARQEGGLTSPRRKAHDVVLKGPTRGQEDGVRSRRDPAPWNSSRKKTGFSFGKGKPAKDFGKKTKRKT
jgi:ATP-dependent RNA helicase DeaD